MSSGPNNAAAVNRDLQLIAPKFRDAVAKAIEACRRKGVDAFVYEAHRSDALQAIYYARGRSVIPPLTPVTNAPTSMYSWHGFGLAVDVISRSRGWDVPVSWFEKVAVEFRIEGCKWGGDWKSRDLPHFQWGRCKPSPSDRARELFNTDSIERVWREVGAIEP